MRQEGADRIRDKNRFRGVVNAGKFNLGVSVKCGGIILLAEGVLRAKITYFQYGNYCTACVVLAKH